MKKKKLTKDQIEKIERLMTLYQELSNGNGLNDDDYEEYENLLEEVKNWFE